MNTLFHIRRIGTLNAQEFLRAGDIIQITGMNCYSRYLWEESLLTTAGRVPFPVAVMPKLPELGQFQLHREMSRRLCKQLVEHVFEVIRRDHFPALPSRTNCIFAASSETAARQWGDSFGPHERYQLLELELPSSGHVFEGDASLVCYDTLPITEIQRYAQHYWKGSKSQKSMPEYLIESPARVLRVIESIGEAVNSE